MGMFETIIFGLLALSSVCAGFMLMKKLPALSAALGIAGLVMVWLCSQNWLLALSDSGKNTALFGFERYPAAVIMLVLLCLAGALCMLLGALRFMKSR